MVNHPDRQPPERARPDNPQPPLESDLKDDPNAERSPGPAPAPPPQQPGG